MAERDRAVAETTKLLGQLAERDASLAALQAEARALKARLAAGDEAGSARVEELERLLASKDAEAARAQGEAKGLQERLAAVEQEMAVQAVEVKRMVDALDWAQDRLTEAEEKEARLERELAAAAAPLGKSGGALRAARRFLGGNGTCTVTFRVRASTTMGEFVSLLGNTDSLGRWSVPRATRMTFVADGVWAAEVTVPSGRVSTYKYLLTDVQGRLIRWQPGADNILSVRADEPRLEVSDDWSGDPTLNSVRSVHDGRVEGRQARLLELLDAIANAAAEVP